MADKKSGEEKKHVYDESKIKTLSSIEHIRLRTGMYIGRVGDGSHYDDGGYILLKEVIDNAIDEFIMGAGKEIQIAIEDKAVTVRDFGRGIPLGKGQLEDSLWSALTDSYTGMPMAITAPSMAAWRAESRTSPKPAARGPIGGTAWFSARGAIAKYGACSRP